MGSTIPSRDDFDTARSHGLTHRSRDGARNRRLLALAWADKGHRRSDSARFAGPAVDVLVNRERAVDAGSFPFGQIAITLMVSGKSLPLACRCKSRKPCERRRVVSGRKASKMRR